MNRSPMELDVWKGDWGLPSVDVECLRVVALCKFSGASIEVNTKRHTLSTPHGKLPVFRHYKLILSTFEEVAKYLATKNLSPDFGLTHSQKGDAAALTNFIKVNLHPALLYVWWLDERNHTNLTRKWFCKTIPFPLQFYFPGLYHDQAEKEVNNEFPHLEEDQSIEDLVYGNAIFCLNSISARLGTQEFMFGNHPTSVDATLYAYLAPLVMVPFPSGKLKAHVFCYNNLVKYVKRISQRYFAAETQAYEAQKAQPSTSGVGGVQIDGFPDKRRNQIVAACVAVVAMATYATTIGLLKIPPNWFNRSVKQQKTTRIPVQYDSF